MQTGVSATALRVCAHVNVSAEGRAGAFFSLKVKTSSSQCCQHGVIPEDRLAPGKEQGLQEM